MTTGMSEASKLTAIGMNEAEKRNLFFMSLRLELGGWNWVGTDHCIKDHDHLGGWQPHMPREMDFDFSTFAFDFGKSRLWRMEGLVPKFGENDGNKEQTSGCWQS
ncbi:MAG: hypothetical protein NTW21_23605 [Verrucomicrobia bacterium]|nr:hypothetical protein [Verrucomicrobiota bacterium]